MWSKWQRWIAFFVVVTEQKKNIDNHFGMTTEYGNAPLFLRKKRSILLSLFVWNISVYKIKLNHDFFFKKSKNKKHKYHTQTNVSICTEPISVGYYDEN